MFLIAILHRVLRDDFFFTSHLLFPFSFWTFLSLFSLDFYFPFLFGLLFPFFLWTFIQSRSHFGFLPNFFFRFAFQAQVNVLFLFAHWENTVDLLKMSPVILSSVSEEFRRNSEERWQYYWRYLIKIHCIHIVIKQIIVRNWFSILFIINVGTYSTMHTYKRRCVFDNTYLCLYIKDVL